MRELQNIAKYWGIYYYLLIEASCDPALRRFCKRIWVFTELSIFINDSQFVLVCFYVYIHILPFCFMSQFFMEVLFCVCYSTCFPCIPSWNNYTSSLLKNKTKTNKTFILLILFSIFVYICFCFYACLFSCPKITPTPIFFYLLVPILLLS